MCGTANQTALLTYAVAHFPSDRMPSHDVMKRMLCFHYMLWGMYLRNACITEHCVIQAQLMDNAPSSVKNMGFEARLRFKPQFHQDF